MSEVIAFADAEALAVSYLKSVMDAKVSTKVPSPRPDKFIRVVRTGGIRTRINADYPQLTFECWATTETDASNLCREARAYVFAMEQESINGTWVYRVTDVGGPSFFPDPQTNTPRYQFTVQVETKGGAL